MSQKFIDGNNLVYYNGKLVNGDILIANANLAPNYDSSVAYQTGSLLSYQGKLYECISNSTAGTLPTNTTYFKETSVAEVIEDLPITDCPTTTDGNYVFQATVTSGTVSYGWMDVYGNILNTRYGE